MANDLVIHGAAGRMGRRLVALSREFDALQLVGAIEYEGSPHLGKDAGVVAETEPFEVEITDALTQLKQGQVVIDFSLPQSLSRLLPAVVDAGATLVCGTTGFSEDQVADLKEASNKIPVLYSPNMSVGVNLLFLAVREMTKWAGEDFDIEVFEMHHKMKRDAPSGTALRIAEHIADVQEQRLADVMKTDRYSQDAPREAGEIGMQSARGGDIVGEHTVFYCGMGERIELTHRATSRDIFARGALRAASWMAQKPAGFYSMFDVLSFAS